MSAYMREINHQCYCGKRALYEVFNHVNASYGYFCKVHANQKVAQYNRDHEAAIARAKSDVALTREEMRR